MNIAVIAFARVAPALALSAVFAVPALRWWVVPSASAQYAPSGDYQRVVLVSWDGVRRDVLFDLLEADPSQPCYAQVFPLATGRVDSQGFPIYTCLPALAGAVPSDAPAGSPAYAPFQMLASHTTNDGTTMTKPQHA